jgi:hypothetical protein
VTLPPGGAQAVRLQLRKPAELEEGEYRSHLLFQALPPAAQSDDAATADGKELDIKLIPVYSVSIPLIVRQGTMSAAVAIRDLAVAKDALTLTLDRKGTRSVYGDLTVSLRNSRGGAERVLARANGVAVYTPNGSRRVRIPLAGQLPPGELHVTFVERPGQPGRVEAESRLVR